MGKLVVTEFVSVDGVVEILGRGKRLFPDGIDRLKLQLVEARQVGPDGVQVQVYRRAA